jgi:arylsulfatase A-like enzyme
MSTVIIQLGAIIAILVARCNGQYLPEQNNGSTGNPNAAATSRPPNILVIYADDLGYGDAGCYGATAVKTPHVDRLAREGLRMTSGYPSDPVEVSYDQPFPGEPTGVSERDHLKMDWDYGHNEALVNGIGRIGHMKGGKAALWKDEDMADTFTRKGIEFIEKNKDKPFFLFFATHDIHVPRIAHDRFVGQTTMGPRGDVIVQFDASVGELLAALDRLKLTDNTLVILSSDNGPVLNDGYKDGAVEKVGNHKPAGPFRGGKYNITEGGTRVPFIVCWPGRIKPGTSDAIVSQVDFCASFAALPDPRIE